MLESPNRIHVFLTCGSIVAALALLAASPTLRDSAPKRSLINSIFMSACPFGTVNSDDVQTATAPAWGLVISASANTRE